MSLNTSDSMSDETVEDKHPIFRTDPSEFMKYLDKEVNVVTVKGTQHTGLVYTIDPVSQTIALVTFPTGEGGGGNFQLNVVLGPAVKSITTLREATSHQKTVLAKLFQPADVSGLSEVDLRKQQETVRSWLAKNHIPVVSNGENDQVLCVADALSIDPPYRAEDCRSTNEIILGRVQGLLKNMPPDFQQW